MRNRINLYKREHVPLICIEPCIAEMGSLILEEQPGMERLITGSPPSHYAVKIQSFSLFTKYTVHMYESGVFQTGGYKWKLVIHPNGNKNKNVKDHISMYLSMVETTSHPQGWEVHTIIKFFLLDQNQDNYQVLQATKERRFREMKLEWGFDQFVPLKAFSDVRKGFLVDDTCVFGAEVFVTKERMAGNGENLTLIKDPLLHKEVWRINSFSKIDMEFVESNVFIAGNHRWYLRLYPKGKGDEARCFVSLYLNLADADSLSPMTKILVEFSLRIIDQSQTRNFFRKATHWFSASSSEMGCARFISQKKFYQRSTGTLVKDMTMVEAEVKIHGVVNAFPLWNHLM